MFVPASCPWGTYCSTKTVWVRGTVLGVGAYVVSLGHGAVVYVVRGDESCAPHDINAYWT